MLRQNLSGFVVDGLQLAEETGLELFTVKSRAQRRTRRKRLLVAVDSTLDLPQPPLRQRRSTQGPDPVVLVAGGDACSEKAQCLGRFAFGQCQLGFGALDERGHRRLRTRI